MKLEHPSHVEIDLDKFHKNVDLIARTAKNPLFPVIKANGYGHGAVALAKELRKRKEVAAIAIGTVSEGVELRKAGIKGRILVLDGVFADQAKLAMDARLEAVVSSLAEAKTLQAAAGRTPVKIHFKINTGMTRLGSDAGEAFGLYKKIAAMPKVSLAGVMTHLADSDTRGPKTGQQLDIFDDFLSSLAGAGFTLPPRHAANSAAIFLHPRARYDISRPGISLYGVQEFAGRDVGLKPILSWRARVAYARWVTKGETVSYGMTWASPGKRKVAVVCAGYADGFSRNLSNRAHAIIGGKKVSQIGTICMDSCLFDVTKTNVRAGDTVTLIGQGRGKSVEITEIAKTLGTIAYEIMCGIGARCPRIYIRSGKIDRTRTKTGN